MKSVLLGLVLATAVAIPAKAATDCEMTFSMTGWSVFYKKADGVGTIHCDNGQSAKVRVYSRGGGVTFGRSRIKDAIGRFTEVDDISELFGTYAQSEAHAGAGASAKASALTKGTVSLSIVGKGRGVDVGISFGKFVIERR